MSLSHALKNASEKGIIDRVVKPRMNVHVLVTIVDRFWFMRVILMYVKNCLSLYRKLSTDLNLRFITLWLEMCLYISSKHTALYQRQTDVVCVLRDIKTVLI